MKNQNVYTKQRMLTALGQPSIDQLMLGTCVPVYKTLGWGWPQKITPLNTPLHMNHIKFLRMGEKRLVNSHRILKDKSYNWYEFRALYYDPATPVTLDLWLTVIITVPCLLFLELGQARVQPVSRLFSVTAGRKIPLLEKKITTSMNEYCNQIQTKSLKKQENYPLPFKKKESI